MPNLLATGVAWLAAQAKACCGVSVVYVRGAEQVPLTATAGQTARDVQEADGLLSRREFRDWLCDAADLQLGGAAVLPVAGDLVRETVGDKTFVYEVRPLGEEPCWRYSDPFRTRLRIHSQLIDVLDAG